MKPIVYWIEKAAWRKEGQAEFEELDLRRGRLRVQKPESIAYFYIEAASQIRTLYENSHGETERIELRLHLQDREEVHTVSGVPKPETPPFDSPPFHLKMHFPFEALSFAEDVG